MCERSVIVRRRHTITIVVDARSSIIYIKSYSRLIGLGRVGASRGSSKGNSDTDGKEEDDLHLFLLVLVHKEHKQRLRFLAFITFRKVFRICK
jgi:hypothetical protein